MKSNLNFVSFRKNLLTSILVASDDQSTYANELATQLLSGNEALTLTQLNTAIDSVTTSDVKAFAGKLVKSKAALSTVGINAPYLDDLL